MGSPIPPHHPPRILDFYNSLFCYRHKTRPIILYIIYSHNHSCSNTVQPEPEIRMPIYFIIGHNLPLAIFSYFCQFLLFSSLYQLPKIYQLQKRLSHLIIKQTEIQKELKWDETWYSQVESFLGSAQAIRWHYSKLSCMAKLSEIFELENRILKFW